MIQKLREHDRWNETLFMGFMTLACLLFSLFRVYYTHSGSYFFLNWNLFLAIIPWGLTSWMLLRKNRNPSKFSLVAIILTWLLFFPNAPYIFTDLFHLRFQSEMPIWFDLILILAYAWTGMLFGLLSLWDLEKIMQRSISVRYVRAISIGLLFVSSFGIYLGRYLRWNSWDILHNPSHLLYDVAHRFVYPFEHPRTWGMTLFMGIFLTMIYGSLRLIKKRMV